MPPRHLEEGLSSPDFTREEMLYRRVDPEELNDRGEWTPARLRFTDEPKACPSVIRENGSEIMDVLHPDCAGGKDVSASKVFGIHVGDLPTAIPDGDGRLLYDFFPVHSPEPTCYAHSVIRSALSSDPLRAYKKPSKAAKNAFRTKFVQNARQIQLS